MLNCSLLAPFVGFQDTNSDSWMCSREWKQVLFLAEPLQTRTIIRLKNEALHLHFYSPLAQCWLFIWLRLTLLREYPGAALLHRQHFSPEGCAVMWKTQRQTSSSAPMLRQIAAQDDGGPAKLDYNTATEEHIGKYCDFFFNLSHSYNMRCTRRGIFLCVSEYKSMLNRADWRVAAGQDVEKRDGKLTLGPVVWLSHSGSHSLGFKRFPSFITSREHSCNLLSQFVKFLTSPPHYFIPSRKTISFLFLLSER